MYPYPHPYGFFQIFNPKQYGVSKLIVIDPENSEELEREVNQYREKALVVMYVFDTKDRKIEFYNMFKQFKSFLKW